MKIRLIEPAAPGMHVWSKVLLPRLGLPMMGAALARQGHDVRVYCQQMAPIDWADVESADLVGISTTTSTATAGYAQADRVRAKEIPVVIGGTHVTFMADEALTHADYVARGEGGEQVMLELVELLEGRRAPESIAGLSFTAADGPRHNPLRERPADLDRLPFPDLSLIVGHERLSTVPIMTSWGCPFACNFCSVTAMFGRRYRVRSVESVIAEIEQKRPKRIFFYDDNFAADRRRLKRLLREMIERDLVVPWSAQVRTDVVRDPELLELMRRSRCYMVYLGLESVDQATLDHFEKSQTVDDIVKAVDTLHAYGVRSHGMFVLGADTDTVQTVRDTVRFCLDHSIDTVMLNILTPLPGTQQYAEMESEGRIFDHEWHHYDAHHVVFRPRNMTPFELQKEVLGGYARFYSVRNMLRCLIKLQGAKQLLFHAWGVWIVRAWRKDAANKAFMRALKKLRPSTPGSPVRDVTR
jgi:radical SAM superfamily enzyme YgiQ (UPF0313 family)